MATPKSDPKSGQKPKAKSKPKSAGGTDTEAAPAATPSAAADAPGRKRVFLIDGSALAYRAFFAKGPGPTFAYASSLLSLVEKERPDFALVAMDTPKPTFRHEKFAKYKATRQKTPPELIAKLPDFERLARALGFELYALDGWEADDVIGTLARQAAEAGHEVYIVTGDKDFMQVIDDRVKMYNPTKPGAEAEIQDAAAVKAKFNCRPDQVIDVLALMGDSSDNIPGVPGIGEKTALKLIEQYEGLDDIYAHLDDIRPPGLQTKLREGRESAYLSQELATIRCDAPISLGVDDLVYGGPDVAAAHALFVEMDFPSLAERLGAGETVEEERAYRIVKTEAQYDAFLEALRKHRRVVFDTETTSIEPLEAELVGLSFSFEEQSAWYLPANLSEPIFGEGDRGLTARERAAPPEGGMFAEKPRTTTGTGIEGDPLVPPAGSDLGRFLADLSPVFADPDVEWVAQNAKYDLHVLSRYGVEVANVAFDTLLASFCLDAHQSQHGLDFLALKHLGIGKIPTSELIGKGAKQISMWDVNVDKCGEYACEDADVTGRLARLFDEKLRGESVESVFRDIEMPTLRVLQVMERHGILVDTDHLRRLSTIMGERLAELTTEIHELAGREFNIDSPKQLQAVLYDELAIQDELGVKRLKKPKSGFSTDAETLELLSEHPLPARILEYRQNAKLKSTYVEALPLAVHPATGRIHTSYNQAGASTGRLSSNNPNLQNIPVRTELGREIRKAFIAADGFELVAADYSQVELRLMAHFTGDEALTEAFIAGDDIHRRTAALVFGVDEDDVTPDQRSHAKTINFGIMYGMGPPRLAKSIHVSVKEAAAFIEAYFATFPAVKAWIDETRDFAAMHGYVETATGRRRKIEHIDASDQRLAANARNMAINTPIQGTAADLIKLAMIEVDARLRDEFPDTRMLLQVHDELVFEVPKADVAKVSARVAELMAAAMDLSVPLVVDTGHGHDWLQAH